MGVALTVIVSSATAIASHIIHPRESAGAKSALAAHVPDTPRVASVSTAHTGRGDATRRTSCADGTFRAISQAISRLRSHLAGPRHSKSPRQLERSAGVRV